MKASLDNIQKHLKSNEEILITLNSTLNLEYLFRTGVLVATSEKLLFCADYMFGEGLTWEYEYADISNFQETNAVSLHISLNPFTTKLIMNHKDELIALTDFSSPTKVNQLVEIIQGRVRA